MKRTRILDLDDDSPTFSDTITARAVSLRMPSARADTVTAQAAEKALLKRQREEALEKLDMEAIEQDAKDNPD